MKIAFAAALFAAAAPAAATALAEPILVTASRAGTSASAQGGAVIGADAIAALQPVTALELLDRIAGVRAFQKGGEGGGSYLSVRGGEPNFTLVLLDGVRVGDPTNSQGGAFDFAQIDPAALDRIEVARGGLSAVHGADALSGVVNMRLRTPRSSDDFGTARLFTDSRGRVGGDATAGLGWTGGGLLLSGGAYDSGDGSAGSSLTRRQLLAKASEYVGGWTLSGLVLHARSERDVFPEDSGGPRLAVIRDRETGNAGLSLAALDMARSDGDDIQPHVSVSWSRQDARSDSPGIAPGVLDGVPPISADTRFDRFEASADIKWIARPGLALVTGLAYRDEDGRSRGIVDFGAPIPADFAIGRRLASGFAEAAVGGGPRKPEVTIAIRYDDPSAARAEWTGRAFGRVPLGPLDLTASWSEGYKLPSLYALAFPFIANPALRPERSNSVEAGIGHSGRNGRIRVGWFRNRFTDLIDFDPALFTNVNRARVVTEGLEAEAGLVVGAVTADASLTWLDVTSATPLRSRPRWQGAARLAWRVREDLVLDAAGRFNSRFRDSSVPTGPVTAAGHAELDFGTRWTLTDRLTLSAVARNLSGARFEESVGFPSGARALRVTVAARF